MFLKCAKCIYGVCVQENVKIKNGRYHSYRNLFRQSHRHNPRGRYTEIHNRCSFHPCSGTPMNYNLLHTSNSCSFIYIYIRPYIFPLTFLITEFNVQFSFKKNETKMIVHSLSALYYVILI